MAIATPSLAFNGDARRNAPTPKPVEGEVLVEVLFSGINSADPSSTKSPKHHKTSTSSDFCGRIVHSPAGSGFYAGDIVAGSSTSNRNHSQQLYISIPPTDIFKVYKHIPLPDAAALPSVLHTANDALFNRLGLHVPTPVRPGPIDGIMVIFGADTAVGVTALQLARAIGIKTIVVTASSSRHALLRELGATHYFDHKDDVVQKVQQTIREDGLLGRPTWAFETVGTEESAQLFLESLRIFDEARLAFVKSPGGDRPSQVALATRPQPNEAAKIRKAIQWETENYGHKFKLPVVQVHDGPAEEVQGELEKLAESGSLARLVLRQQLV